MCIPFLKYFRLRSLWPTTRDYYFMNIHKGQFYQSIFFICHRNKKLNAKSSVILNVFCDEKSLRLVFKRMEFNHWDGENKAHCFIPKTCFVPIFHIFFFFHDFILHLKEQIKIWGVNEKCSYYYQIMYTLFKIEWADVFTSFFPLIIIFVL